MSPEEGVQHGAQEAGHAPVHDKGPLGVGHVQVVDQQQLGEEVGGPHHQPPQEAGPQPHRGHAAVRTCGNKRASAKVSKCARLYAGGGATVGTRTCWHLLPGGDEPRL